MNRFSSRAMCAVRVHDDAAAEQARRQRAAATQPQDGPAGSQISIPAWTSDESTAGLPFRRDARMPGPGDPGLDDPQVPVEDDQVGNGPGAMTPKPCSPSARAGVVEHTVAASTGSSPTSRYSFANARSIVSELPASVPSSRYAASRMRDRAAAERRGRAVRQAGSRRAVGDRHDPRRAAWPRAPPASSRDARGRRRR